MYFARLILICAAFILPAVPVLAGDEQESSLGNMVLDMEETVKMGLERSHRIQAHDYGIRRSESEVKSVRGQFFPQLSAGAGFTHLDSRSARGPTDQDYLDQQQYQWNFRAVQTLFAGMTILSSYQKARIEKEISELEKESAERELIREIQYYFLELLKAREDRRSLESSIERLEMGLEASKSFFERQLVPYVDVLQAEVELQEARQELSQARNEEQIQRTRLNAILGFGHDQIIGYEGDLGEIPLELFFESQDVMDIALKQRTDLVFIRKNMAAAEQEQRIARGRKMPRLNLEFTYMDRKRDYEQPAFDAMTGQTRDRDQRNRHWTTGLNLEWNFFSGGQQYYRHEAMGYEIRRLVQTLQDTKASILTEVRTAHMRLDEARSRLVSNRKALAAAQENFDMQEHRYKQQVGTITDLLTAQEHLTRAETNKNQALMDYQQALSELYFAMGERNYGLK
ncbi:TolC family protein [Desulfonatronospira sp.]|uniref:TolC family protein n=1 Tax=Desulfonatronospira sp. TaxID=1962951 RepID=UPI0025B8C5BA|nr:TolC family protein [Desulfonatronospira sp.]